MYRRNDPPPLTPYEKRMVGQKLRVKRQRAQWKRRKDVTDTALAVATGSVLGIAIVGGAAMLLFASR